MQTSHYQQGRVPAARPAVRAQTPEEILAAAQRKLQVLEHRCKLSQYWLEQAHTDSTSTDPCIFPEDVTAIKASHDKAVEDFTKASQALEHAMGMGQTGDAEAIVSRRQSFFAAMHKSGMDHADPKLMDGFARDQKTLIDEVREQKQQVYRTLQSANLGR